MSQLAKLSLVFVLLASASASQAHANSWYHISQIANRINQRATLLISEVEHYRLTPHYNHLKNDAIQLQQLAQHIELATQQSPSFAHIQADLSQLENSLHHLMEVFGSAEFSTACHRAHIIGDIRHVRRLLRGLDRNIQHLRYDLHAMRASVMRASVIPAGAGCAFRHSQAHPHAGFANVHANPGIHSAVSGHGASFRIGNGDFGLHIRF